MAFQVEESHEWSLWMHFDAFLLTSGHNTFLKAISIQVADIKLLDWRCVCRKARQARTGNVVVCVMGK